MPTFQNLWRKVIEMIDIPWLCHVHWMNDKPTLQKAYNPAPIEHIANIITHGVWVVPSILACSTLIQRSTTWSQYWSAVVYGASLILLFSVSTVFHLIFYCGHSRNLKDILHRCDRAMIYVFIAASYFPWLMLQPLPTDSWTTELHWAIWVLASLGILYQQIFHEQYKWLEVLFYLIMGVAPSLGIIYMYEFSGLTELKIGGCVYILGILFFKADGKIPCAHAIWHLFVVTAAGIHYYAILNYLFPKMTISP